MTRLKLILSGAYWLVAAFLLWEGYKGDAALYAANPVNHTPAFDTFAVFVLVAIAYGVICGVWWAVAALNRRRPTVTHG